MINKYNSKQDKFGFYTVGDLKTYRKFEAVEAHLKTNQPLQWNFNQELYSAIDWTVEPSETLSELYRQRAQTLREQYDYLVLWYSGGADSANILNTFLNHDIKLDEVASYVNYEATKDKFDYLNGEIFNVAGPAVELAKQQQPWLKHTIIDISQITVDIFTENSTKFDWIYNVNTYVNPNTAARKDIKLQVPHWKKMFDSGKKVGFVYGTDKPKVTGINGKYYFRFLDMIDNAVNVVNQTENREWEFDELFYWDPHHASIVVKQGHVVKNFFKAVNEDSKFLVKNKFPGVTSSSTVNQKLYWLTLDGLHMLIYPWWHPVPYQFKSSIVLSPRDTWFFNLPDSDLAKRAWKIGIEQRWKTSPEYLKNSGNSLSQGFKRMSSIPYCLGT